MNKYVWVVRSIDYESQRIMGIYSRKPTANTLIALLSKCEYTNEPISKQQVEELRRSGYLILPDDENFDLQKHTLLDQ